METEKFIQKINKTNGGVQENKITSENSSVCFFNSSFICIYNL